MTECSFPYHYQLSFVVILIVFVVIPIIFVVILGLDPRIQGRVLLDPRVKPEDDKEGARMTREGARMTKRERG